MVATDVAGLEADYWTGNLHKWVCAPKGSAVLWVAPEQRERVHPLITSHGRGQGFHAEFDWTGTHDPTPFLAAPAALDFMGGFCWERVTAHNHALAALGRQTVAAAAGTAQLVDEGRFGSMSLVALPDGWVHGYEDALAFEAVLRDRHRVEVPVIWWDGRALLRLSAQVYNAPGDYERLAAVLPSAARMMPTTRT
jgi:isopenicillin-N epimerase